ncbi:unnamed protein product [Clonostachys chloroleuca]|uniref:Uncharacterized protein n=1 Tax=Clonostachys chloroleuca TaxID=1926264 RepID=A0AA35VKV0_9HYPO|nr:unnamed protein product [Clonostachys chloroleuca]
MGARWAPYNDTPNLEGKVAVVTGSNSGIGLYTALHLALHGAKVYMGARTKAKADDAKKTVLSLHPTIAEERLIWLPLDLSKLSSVQEAVKELEGKEQKIDILINNAGLATNEIELTDAGWEMTMAVCHVGHFVLSNGLLSLLKKAAAEKGSDVRVVTVSSSASHTFLPPGYKIDFSKPDFLKGNLPYEPWKYRYVFRHMFTIKILHYSLAKMANIMFAQELQRRLDKLGVPIISLSLNPGAVKSDNAVSIFSGFLQPLMRQVMLTLDEGSFTSLFAATAPEVWRQPEVYKGKYLEPVGKVQDPLRIAQDEKQAQALWDTTTKEVNRYLLEHGLPTLHDL